MIREIEELKTENEEKERTDTRIKSIINLMQKLQQETDCMFKAISLRITGTVNLYQQFRKICFKEIWQNLDKYKDFLISDNHLEYL